MSTIRKMIKIISVENRAKDAWFDFGLRQIREGAVIFHKATDFLTGSWLFKACIDEEQGKTIIKALKCPPGKIFAQIEGSTMMFQRSKIEGFVYDIISLTYTGEDERVRREIITDLDKVPASIKDNFEIKKYEEATGKTVIGKNLVTIVRDKDVKDMIILFLMERAWPLASISPETGLKEENIVKLIDDAEKASIDEIYALANERLNMMKDDVDKLLDLLKNEGKIDSPSPGYVKIVKG